MTVVSEACSSNISNGSEGAVTGSFSFLEPVNWETHKSYDTGVMTNQTNVLAKEITGLRFSLLLEKWRGERGPASSVSDIVGCNSYQQIIRMGKRALPLILDQLKQEGNEPDHWFVALRTITGENPIPDNARGNMPKMAEAWLAWAEENNVW